MLSIITLHADWTYVLAHYSGAPLLGSIAIGLLMALDPCILSTTFAAIGIIAREQQSRKATLLAGLFYALGRLVAYMALALILLPVMRRGLQLEAIQEFFHDYGLFIFPPLFIAIGIFMIWDPKLPFSLPSVSAWAERVRLSSHLATFWVGLLFALAFCPATVLLYFGGLMPLALTATSPWLAHLLFALATCAPTLLIAWILAYSMVHLAATYQHMQRLQRGLNLTIALLFIASGVIYIILAL